MIKQAGVYFSVENTSLKHWQKNGWKAVKKKKKKKKKKKSHFICFFSF